MNLTKEQINDVYDALSNYHQESGEYIGGPQFNVDYHGDDEGAAEYASHRVRIGNILAILERAL